MSESPIGRDTLDSNSRITSPFSSAGAAYVVAFAGVSFLGIVRDSFVCLNLRAITVTPTNPPHHTPRSEEHTSELQSLMRISYAVFCLTKKTREPQHTL